MHASTHLRRATRAATNAGRLQSGLMAALSLNQIIADELIKRQARMSRVEAGLQDEARAILSDLTNELSSTLARVNWDSGTVPQRYARLEKLKSAIDKAIREKYGDLQDQTDQNASDLAENEAAFIGKTYDSAIGVNIFDITLSDDLLSTLTSDVMIQGAPSSAWWLKSGDDLMHSFMSEMRMGIQQGENLSDLVRRVRGRRENGFNDGIMSTSTRNAEALVRTSAQTVLNETRMAMYAQNEDLLGGYLFSATLDLRTTPTCRAYDGQKWDTDGTPQEGTTLPYRIPPLHYG